MNFPLKPTCHLGEPRFDLASSQWRPADGIIKPANPRRGDYEGKPFESCSYCGSMHPAALIKALEAGAKLEGADWKYGWPHKFYVVGIPNPLVGMTYTDRQDDYAAPTIPCPNCVNTDGTPKADPSLWQCNVCHGLRVIRTVKETTKTAGPYTTGKFYNVHIRDEGFDGTARDLLIEAIAKHTRIKFVVEGAALKYTCI